MKFLLLFCSLLFASCGSPLDEGYWKEHNQQAPPREPDEEIEYNINLLSLHDGITISFSSQTLKKLSAGKISISAQVSHPAEVILTRYRIEEGACDTYSSGPYTYNNADQSTTLTRNSVELSEIADKPLQVLEGQFLYVYATLGGAGTTAVRLACSAITR